MNIRNKVSLIGRIGIEPNIIELQNGDHIAKITLATNERYRKENGVIEENTQWHNLVIFGKKVETVQKYLQKGQEIAIEGRLKNRSWETKNGEKKYATEIVVQNFLMLEHRKAG